MKKIAGVVPAGILDQHVAILGKTRSGKSSVMRQMVESLLEAGKPVCIVDPKGDWWGIKLAADGKGPGYPLVIFGGERADVPINEHAGAHVAELFATGNRSCLADLGGWTVGARTRFWIDFASTLFKLTKGQRWLAVDEFHNFCPKGKVMDADAGKMLHWSNRLASEGLGKGLNMLFASQRPQKVHNDSLTSAETLVAMRVLHPSDRGAVSDWIKGCGDGSGDEVLNSLGQMERGEGWVWSPEIGFGPKRVKFPMFSTYDSFRPQTVEDTKRLKGWAEVDLDEVRAKLANVVEEAKANDPKELKRQVSELKNQVAKLTAAQQKAAPVDVGSSRLADLKPALTDADRELLRKVESRLIMIDVKAGEIATQAEERAKRLVEGVLADHIAATRAVGAGAASEVTELLGMASVKKLIEKLNGLAVVPAPVSGPVRQVVRPTSPLGQVSRGAAPVAQRTTSAPVARTSPPVGDGDSLTPAKRRILNAMAFLHHIGVETPDKSQVALLAGTSPNGGSYRNNVSSLRTAALIDYPSAGTMALTDAGNSAAVLENVPETSAELHEVIKGMVPPAKWRIVEALIEAYPNAITKEDLAARVETSADGGSFRNNVSSLRTFGLLDYPRQGMVQATSVLFLEGR